MYKKFILTILIMTFGRFILPAQQDSTDVRSYNLSEVVVAAKLPLVKMESGKMIYRFNGTLLQSNGSLYDALRSLPGISIDIDGKIYINGKDGAVLMIDDKNTYLSGQDLVNYLKSTPAQAMRQAEIITTPSAKYDANGVAGILNVVSKKQKVQGADVATNASGAPGRTGYGNASTNINVKYGKINISANYSYYQGKDAIDMNTERNYTLTNETMRQKSLRKRMNYIHYLRTGVAYDITQTASLGVNLIANSSRQNEDANMNNWFNTDFLANTSKCHTSRSYLSPTIYLQKKWENGEEIYISFDHFRYINRSNQNLTSNFPDTITTNVNGITRLWVFQIDFEQPICKQWKIQAGMKFSKANIKNRSVYTHNIHSTSSEIPSTGNDFFCNENISALYAQGIYATGSWNTMAGLRLEKDRNDTKLFPSASVNYRTGGQHQWQLAYTTRILRPNYEGMNSFIYIHDAYTYEQGNPDLKPALTYKAELRYQYRQKLSVAYVLAHEKNAIRTSYQTDGNRVYVSTMNLPHFYQTGIELSLMNLNIWKPLTTNLSIMGTYNSYRWNENGEKRTSGRLTPIAACLNSFSLPAGIKAELLASYTGGYDYAQSFYHPSLILNATVSKSFFKNQLTVLFYAKDLLNQNNPLADITTSGLKATIDMRCNLRQIGISLSWHLKKGIRTKKNDRKTEIDEIKRINL